MYGPPRPFGQQPPPYGAYPPGTYGQPPPYSAPPPGASGYQPPYGPPPAHGTPVAGPYGMPPRSYGAPPPAAAPAPWGQTPPPLHHYVPQAAAVPRPMPPAGGRQKKAVLVGCSYQGTSAELKGCCNDVQCMSHALKKHFGFTDSSILTLRDDGKELGRDFVSNRANIFKGIQWLLTGMQPGSSLVFHFSGHGSQKVCRTGDEEDGMDETICPSDFKSAGQIIDNDLNRYLVSVLPPGVTLHCVIDACHSGTAMDLPYTTEYDPQRRVFGWRKDRFSNKGTRGGTAIQIGACRDNQVAQDTSSLSRGTYTGAATFSFIQALESFGPRQTYAQLLGHMSSALHRATSGGNANAGALGGGGITDMLFGLLAGGMGQAREPQIPVLSCDKPIHLGTQLML